MEGKAKINLKMVVEEVKDMDQLSQGRYYGDRINVDHLVLDFLLAIDELVHDSTNLKIEDVKQKKHRGGKIVVDLQIAAEDMDGLAELPTEEIEGVEVLQAARVSPV